MSRNEERVMEIKDELNKNTTLSKTIKEAIQTKTQQSRKLLEIDRDVAEDMYDEFLDKDGPISVGGFNFAPSFILNSFKPVDYELGLTKYISTIDVSEYSEEYKELQSEIEDLSDVLLNLDYECVELKEELENLMELIQTEE